MKAEKGAMEAGVSDGPKVTDRKGEQDGEESEDDDDGVGGGLGKVARELAFKDGQSVHAEKEVG